MSQRLTQRIEFSTYTGLVTPMPGSPDLAVSHAVFLKSGDNGHGKAASKMRMEQIKEMGYSAAICIVNLDNVKQRRILSANSWLEGPQFYNRRTKSGCSIWVQQL